MEAELKLEKQRSMSEQAQKSSTLEAEAFRLEVEAQALEKEDYDPDSLRQRVKDFETIPVNLGQEAIKIKPNKLPENSTESEVKKVPTSTHKQGLEH